MGACVACSNLCPCHRISTTNESCLIAKIAVWNPIRSKQFEYRLEFLLWEPSKHVLLLVFALSNGRSGAIDGSTRAECNELGTLICSDEMAATQSFLTLVSRHRTFSQQTLRTFFKAAMTVKLALWIHSINLLNGTPQWHASATVPADQQTFLCNVACLLFLVANRQKFFRICSTYHYGNLTASSQCQPQWLI